MSESEEVRVPYDELVQTLSRALMKFEFTSDRARLAAQLFANAVAMEFTRTA